MSVLFDAVDDYIGMRRSLGFKLREDEKMLHDFVEFLECEGASHITTTLALRWATQPASALPAHRVRRLSIVRLFARHWSATDPRTEVPPAGILPGRYHRTEPYIYKSEEILRLVTAAGRLRTRTGLRPLTYSTLVGLIAVTGLRVSESIALDRNDVDFSHGILTIRWTKFGKTRLVPIHPSTQEVLRQYSRRRDAIFPRATSPSFFISEQERRLTGWGAWRAFDQMSRECGLRPSSDRRWPRLHDLRHTFAVRTLLDWYRKGVDVERRIPHLSTYLGHGHVSDTFWYLSGVPELLQLAAERLDGPTAGGPSS